MHGKGSRQIRSVTSGKGLALRAGLVGLQYEAGVEPEGLGVASLACSADVAVPVSAVGSSRGLRSRVGAVRRVSCWPGRVRNISGTCSWSAVANVGGTMLVYGPVVGGSRCRRLACA